MTYTFIGDKDYINKEVNKLGKNFNDENIVHYNLEDSSIKEAIQDLNTVSLFGDKLVIVHNIEKIDNEDELINYLENESSNTLVITSFKELDRRKKLTKILSSKTKLKEFFGSDFSFVIEDFLEGYKMNSIAINLLTSYCSNNLSRIENELEKLKLYKLDEKEITTEDVEKLVKKSYDATIFDLIDNINEKNIDEVFKIYNELLEEGETEEKILYTIANHYRLLYQVSVKVEDLSDAEIIKEYKMHPYRLTKLKEQLGLTSKKYILKILKSLSQVDIDVKSGKQDISTGMFLFFKNL